MNPLYIKIQMAAAPQEGHVPGAGGIIVDVNVDVDLDTESPTEQPWEDVGISNLTNQSDYMAVRVLRECQSLQKVL